MTTTQRRWRDSAIYGLVIVIICEFVMMVGYVGMLETDGPQSLVPFFKILFRLGAVPLLPGIAVAWIGLKQVHADSLSIALTATFIVNLLVYIPLSYWILRRRSYKNG